MILMPHISLSMYNGKYSCWTMHSDDSVLNPIEYAIGRCLDGVIEHIWENGHDCEPSDSGAPGF
jgi:hypothetical protein